MRTVTFGGAISLDNYLARPDHAVDWLMWSAESAEMMADYWKTIDTMLVGRKTYELMMRNAPAEGGDMAAYGDIKTYVFSSTLKEVGKGMTLVREDVVGFVREIKKQPGKGILLMGGGELARPLFDAGLIDELGWNIHPVLLGSGIPAYHAMTRQTDLELKECKVFKNGCVNVRYRVKG